MGVQILRAGDRAAMPWKNGGGVTLEIAAWPLGADLASFEWRVSMATVAQGGPFSTFPGVDRSLSVLEGELILTIAGRDALRLDARSAPAEFPGDAATSAQTPASPVRDLNVMTRRGLIQAKVTRLRLMGRQGARAADPTLIISRAPGLRLVHAGASHGLDTDDAALIEDASGESFEVVDAAEAFIIDLRRRT